MKPILLIIVTIMLIGFHAKECFACWCRREVVATEGQFRKSVAKEVDRSAAVFVGEIIEQKGSQLTIKVDRVWKGKISEKVLLITHNWDDGDVGAIDSCAYPFVPGGKYLIYAYKSKGELFTTKCSRTQLFSLADRDLAELDRSRRSQTPTTPQTK